LSSNAENHDRLRGYLLGVIPWQEASDIEQRLLGEEEFYEELLVAEDELVDLYVSDRLPPSDRERFESHFLVTAERREKARFGKLFCDYLASRQVAEVPAVAPEPSEGTIKKRKAWLSLNVITRHPVLSFAMVLVVCAGLFALLWIVREKGFRKNLAQLRTETLAVTLVPGAVRDVGTTPAIQVSPKILAVEFELQTGAGTDQNYQAEVLYETERVWSEDHLKPEISSGQKSVLLVVPADLLKPGYYQIKLRGASASGEFELVNRYAFRVVSQ
jgi:hypothetical protein